MSEYYVGGLGLSTGNFMMKEFMEAGKEGRIPHP
jgi:hypothetical protein